MNKIKHIVINKFLTNKQIDKIYLKIKINYDVSTNFYKYIKEKYGIKGITIYTIPKLDYIYMYNINNSKGFTVE